jgi:hypothetical protein
MDKKSIKKLLYLPFIILLTTGLLIFLIFSQSILNFLSKTEKVDANILLVEGWLPHNALENTRNEFQNRTYDLIITTGNNIHDNFYTIYGSGYMTFYAGKLISTTNGNHEHTIELEAFSELEGENCAHFDFYVNDSLMADFYADKKKRKYGITWKGDIAKIDSVMVHFDNDKWGVWGDRNLYVKEIIIDNTIHLPYFLNSKYDYLTLDGKDKILFRFSSYAELAKNTLLSLGIDTALVVAVPGENATINRTLTSAKSFKKWLDKSNIKIKGINIVSLSAHARRTWMVYKKVLGKTYKIGIISVPDTGKEETEKHKLLTSLREILGIGYYWIILIPYSF